MVDEISLDFHSASNDATDCHWGSRVKETFVVDVVAVYFVTLMSHLSEVLKPF